MLASRAAVAAMSRAAGDRASQWHGVYKRTCVSGGLSGAGARGGSAPAGAEPGACAGLACAGGGVRGSPSSAFWLSFKSFSLLRN